LNNLSRAVISALAAAALLVPTAAFAELPELKVAPLRYQAHLDVGQVKTGFIDASNPTGTSIHVAFQVQAFRQANDQGELEFYDDARLSAAVTPALPEFEIGPREAVRTRFTIDASRLGPGGAYGVIFLRTVPTGQASGQIATSARVGTLLILDVGGTGTKSGRISGLKLPRLVFGWHQKLPVAFSYQNTGSAETALSYFPELDVTAGFTGKPHKLTGPLVFPKRTRAIKTTLPADNLIGLVPVSVHDHVGGSAPATTWMLADTGIWATLTLLAPVALLLWILRKKLLISWRKLLRLLRK
jgi:hypothetical protein